MTLSTITRFRDGRATTGLLSYSEMFAITPNDSTDLTTFTRGLYTGSGGAISLILADDSVELTLSNVPAGAILPLFVKRVRFTGTTATNMRGLR